MKASAHILSCLQLCRQLKSQACFQSVRYHICLSPRVSWTSAPFFRVVQDDPAFTPSGDRECLPLTQPYTVLSPTASTIPATTDTVPSSTITAPSTALTPAAAPATTASVLYTTSSVRPGDSRRSLDVSLEYCLPELADDSPNPEAWKQSGWEDRRSKFWTLLYACAFSS